jgi:hypothetical protein
MKLGAAFGVWHLVPLFANQPPLSGVVSVPILIILGPLLLRAEVIFNLFVWLTFSVEGHPRWF